MGGGYEGEWRWGGLVFTFSGAEDIAEDKSGEGDKCAVASEGIQVILVKYH